MRRSYDVALFPPNLPQVMHTSPLLTAALRVYADQWPQQAEIAAEFEIFLASSPDVFLREHAAGHFTGSAWLVSADRQHVLLTHHRKLGRWLQLGGHADGDADLAQVTLREALEESGLSDLVVENAIFDLDRHRIPMRANEPEHWHYDVRYIVRATGSETFAISEESLALAWKPIHAIADDEYADLALRRMAQKWLVSQRAVG